MKITQQTAFQPIIITLETPSEARAMRYLASFGTRKIILKPEEEGEIKELGCKIYYWIDDIAQFISDD